MIRFLLTIGAVLLFFWATAQNSDTTIFEVVEEMPRFPGCELRYEEQSEKAACAQERLLSFIYENIYYPDSARLKGIEGTVVIQFVVEKDGTVSNASVVKDIGGGCGEVARKVVMAMNAQSIRWIPGKKGGQPVRVQFNLPVRFKLEQPRDYILVGRDSIWTKTDQEPGFKGGDEALQAFLAEQLVYPNKWKDSCYIGHIDVSLLVRPNGETKVMGIANYSNLNEDFAFEAIHTGHQSWFNWEPASYEGRPVPALTDVRMTFLPEAAGCAHRRGLFEQAEAVVEEGAALFNEGETTAGIAKLSEAIEWFPENAQYKYMRGQAYLQLQRFGEACLDYRYVRQVLNVPEVDQITFLICGQKQEAVQKEGN